MLSSGGALLATPQLGAVPALQAPAGPTVPSAPRLGTAVASGPAPMAGAIPRRLALPTLQVDAPIVPVGLLPSGGLGGPPHPHVLGWWPDGARPATRHGSVVIDGHVDTARRPRCPVPPPRAAPRGSARAQHRAGVAALRDCCAAQLPQGPPIGRGVRLQRATPSGPYHLRRRVQPQPSVAEALWMPVGTALGTPSSTSELCARLPTALTSNSAHSERPSYDWRCSAIRMVGTCAGRAGISLLFASASLPRFQRQRLHPPGLTVYGFGEHKHP
jgi:hypothetical protein